MLDSKGSNAEMERCSRREGGQVNRQQEGCFVRVSSEGIKLKMNDDDNNNNVGSNNGTEGEENTCSGQKVRAHGGARSSYLGSQVSGCLF